MSCCASAVWRVVVVKSRDLSLQAWRYYAARNMKAYPRAEARFFWHDVRPKAEALGYLEAEMWMSRDFLERRHGYARHYLGFGGAVEAGGAEGVAGPGDVGEAGGGDELEHARGAGESFDRGWEVAVGGGLAGDEAA